MSFMKFCKDYLNMSENVYTELSDATSYPLADYYITGSDQVWGGTQPKCFLSFVRDDKKKISYAASFGKGEITKEHLETITPWVKQFTHVSVREAEGVDICRQMGVNAQHLLDPTLLLNECDYPHQKLKIKRTYVFVYWLNLRSKSDVRWSEIEAFAKQSGNDLKICAVQGSQYLFSNAELVYPSPVAWLSYYQQAQYIVTNTFLGTVFAIIHRKPFLCILQSGASANQNTRMKSLLFSLGLEDRILKLEENIATAMSKSIDWNQVTDTIQLCRKKSDAFFSFLDD